MGCELGIFDVRVHDDCCLCGDVTLVIRDILLFLSHLIEVAVVELDLLSWLVLSWSVLSWLVLSWLVLSLLVLSWLPDTPYDRWSYAQDYNRHQCTC